MNAIKTLTTQAATACAAVVLHDGLTYITTGHGFHPVAAGALALALLVVPYFIPAPTAQATRSARHARRIRRGYWFD